MALPSNISQQSLTAGRHWPHLWTRGHAGNTQTTCQHRNHSTHFYFCNPPQRMCIDFRERGRVDGRERNIDVREERPLVASHSLPDLGRNLPPFGTGPTLHQLSTQPGLNPTLTKRLHCELKFCSAVVMSNSCSETMSETFYPLDLEAAILRCPTPPRLSSFLPPIPGSPRPRKTPEGASLEFLSRHSLFFPRPLSHPRTAIKSDQTPLLSELSILVPTCFSALCFCPFSSLYCHSKLYRYPREGHALPPLSLCHLTPPVSLPAPSCSSASRRPLPSLPRQREASSPPWSTEESSPWSPSCLTPNGR